MKNLTLLRLVLSDGSSEITRVTRLPKNKTYIVVRRNKQDDKLELKELPRREIIQEDERYLGVFHVHPIPSPIYFESFHCGTVTASRDDNHTKDDPYEPINKSPESFVLYDDDEHSIALHIDDYSIHIEKRQLSSQDRSAMGIHVENTELQEIDHTPKPAHMPGELGSTIVGRDIQVSRSMEDLGSETEDLGSEGDHEDLLVKETQEEMVPSTEENKLSVVARSRRAHSRTPQPLLSTLDDRDSESGMVDDAKIVTDHQILNEDKDEDTDMPDSLPPAFHKTTKQQTPRRTYKDRNRKKILDTPEEEELEKEHVEVEQEAEASPLKSRPTRKTNSTAARSKRTRLNKDEHVEEVKNDEPEEPTAEDNASVPESSPKPDTPEEPNPRTSKRRKTATEKAKAVPDDEDSAEADAGESKKKSGTVGKRKRKDTDSMANEISPAHSETSTPMKSMDPPKSKKEEPTTKTRGTRAASAALSSQGHTPQKTFLERADDSAAPRTTKKYSGDTKSMKIIFSNSKLEHAKETNAFLRSKKIKPSSTVVDKNVKILVVGTGEIKKTSKLLLSIAMGKIIVDDQWLIDSQRAGELLDTQLYCPTDPAREVEWNVKFSEILQQDSSLIDQNLQIFQDKSVFFTPAIRRSLQNAASFDDFKNMVTITGGTILTKSPKDMVLDNSCIIVSIDDKENKKFMEGGKRVYKTDLITLSILRGVLDLENKEYMLSS